MEKKYVLIYRILRCFSFLFSFPKFKRQFISEKKKTLFFCLLKKISFPFSFLKFKLRLQVSFAKIQTYFHVFKRKLFNLQMFTDFCLQVSFAKIVTSLSLLFSLPKVKI